MLGWGVAVAVAVGGGVHLIQPDDARGSVCSPKLPPAMSPLLDWHRRPLITFPLCCCGSCSFALI